MFFNQHRLWAYESECRNIVNASTLCATFMRHFIYIFITLFLAVVFISCNSQRKKTSFRKEHLNNFKYTHEIVNAIEVGNRIESSHIGMAGSPSSQWDLYEQLKETATIEELTNLTDHKNTAVRC